MLQKYTIMLLSKIIFLGHKNTFPHRTVTKHIERLQNSRIEAVSPISHACCTAVSKMPQWSLGAHDPDATTGLVAFGHFFLSSHVETAHAHYARGYKITELCRHNARCFEGSIMLEIMLA